MIHYSGDERTKLRCSVWKYKESHFFFPQGICNIYFNIFAPCISLQCLTETCQCQSNLERASSPVLLSLFSQKFWCSLAEIKGSLTDEVCPPGLVYLYHVKKIVKPSVHLVCTFHNMDTLHLCWHLKNCFYIFKYIWK